jgi:PAS domain S-box-containing protein
VALNELTVSSRAEDLVAAFFDAADVMCGVFALEPDDYRYVVVNPAAAMFYGRRPEDLVGRSGREMGLSAAQVATRLQALRGCWDDQRPRREEYRFEHEGRTGWFLGSFTPLPGEAPRVGFVLVDITRQKTAERKLANEGRKLQIALESAQLGAWEYDIAADVVSWDARMRQLFEVGPEVAVDLALYEHLLHPDDREAVLAAYRTALSSTDGGYQLEHRTHAGRWVRATGQVVFAPDGRALRVLGTARDITAERRAREQERLLLAELNHRVKNNLATVQSIAAQTARSARDLSDFVEDFEGRLLALARAHDVLTATAWSAAQLGDVLRAELAVFGASVAMEGPPVALSASNALALGLIVHELSTNAAKYGALSVPGGVVRVAWSCAAGRLVFTWREQGGPDARPPAAAGFGSTLIRRLAERELRGSLHVDYVPEGLFAELAWALDAEA